MRRITQKQMFWGTACSALLGTALLALPALASLSKLCAWGDTSPGCIFVDNQCDWGPVVAAGSGGWGSWGNCNCNCTNTGVTVVNPAGNVNGQVQASTFSGTSRYQMLPVSSPQVSGYVRGSARCQNTSTGSVTFNNSSTWYNDTAFHHVSCNPGSSVTGGRCRARSACYFNPTIVGGGA